MVQIQGSIVVAILLAQSGDKTGRVARVGSRLAVANLAPQILAALSTAAAEEEVVIDFVVGGGLRAVKHGW